MNLSDEEVGLVVKWNELSKAFKEAKKGAAKDPEGYAKAKAEMSAFRTYWRQVRDGVTAEQDQGAAVAAPATIKGTAAVKTAAKGK